MLKITLIMPVYNAENYLEKSIQSILHQSFNDFELICVDDNSTDTSLQILSDFAKKDNRVTVKENAELLRKSLNDIITMADGDYIVFADSDNILREDFLESIVQKLMQMPVDMLLFKRYSTCDETSKLLALMGQDTFNHKNLSQIIFELDASLFGKAYRKDFLTKNSSYFNENADYEPFFYNALLAAEKIAYLDKEAYQTNNNKRISNDLNAFEKCIEIQDNILETFSGSRYYGDALNNKLSNIITKYDEILLEYKKQAYMILKREFHNILEDNDAEEIINLLTSVNRKAFEQIIITETVEEYELLKNVYQDKKTVNYNKRYEKILKTEHQKIKRFNNSLKSSNSWKLTKIFRL